MYRKFTYWRISTLLLLVLLMPLQGKTIQLVADADTLSATQADAEMHQSNSVQAAQQRLSTTSRTGHFHGVNWADKRDNYADDEVVPSGLDKETDKYGDVLSKAKRILEGFQQNLGANTVRLPINPPSVNGDWWNAYKGAIDAATGRGMKVILGYWESKSSMDGRVDELADSCIVPIPVPTPGPNPTPCTSVPYWSMWEKVIHDYGANESIY